MIFISTLLDPKYVFLVYAPILFALNKRVGHRMLIALTLSEWANQVLKWLLAGERPYWYVHERANELAQLNNFTAAPGASQNDGQTFDLNSALTKATAQPLARLKQFPVTCELGAGSPSGHAMVTATVWYILINSFLNDELPIFKRVNYNPNQNQNRNREQLGGQLASAIGLALTKLSWSLYTLMLMSVSLSRVYLACHFPHQCLCGAVLGIVIAKLVTDKLPMQLLERKHFVITTGLMFLSAMSTYAILRSLGVNPLWSVDRGMRWCVKKEYIHLDTTPFFSMMRYLGFCLGSGLAYDSGKIIKSYSANGCASEQSFSLTFRRALVAIASVAFGQFLLSLPIPRSNLQLFYLISFLIYTLFSYSIARPIPKLVKQHVDNFTSMSKLKDC